MSARFLFDSGVDVITAGNHTFRRKESYDLFDSCETLLRPANFPSLAPGRGYCVVDMGRIQVGVLNLMGVVYMESMDSPLMQRIAFWQKAFQKLLWSISTPRPPEKRSPWHIIWTVVYLRVFGTHTHVQTAGRMYFEHGTGYISDLGMTGPKRSVLGVKPELVIQKMRSKMPVRFDLADGACEMGCVLFTIDEKQGKQSLLNG